MLIEDSIGILNVIDNKQRLIINKLSWENENEEEDDDDMEFLIQIADDDDMEFLIQIADKEAYKLFMKNMYFNKKDMIKLRDFLNKHL